MEQKQETKRGRGRPSGTTAKYMDVSAAHDDYKASVWQFLRHGHSLGDLAKASGVSHLSLTKIYTNGIRSRTVAEKLRTAAEKMGVNLPQIKW